MAYLPVEQQKEAIIHVGVIGLGMSHADVEAMIATRGEDRLELNKLRVKLNTQHRSACGQINRAADNREADTRAALALVTHDATLEQAARDRRAERDRLPPGERVNRALAGLNAMSTVPAASMPDPNLKDVKIPKYAQWQDPGVGRHEQVDVSPILAGLTYLVEQLELVLDAERGVLPPHELAKLPGDVKDRVILTQLRGVHADTIAEAMPWLGGARTIKNLRREAGQRPVDGTDGKERGSDVVSLHQASCSSAA